MVNIKIKRFNKEVKLPHTIENGDWIDLRSAETITLNPGEFYMLKLGIGMIIPEGYEAHIVPRSSTFKKFGILLVNSVGIIDNSYSGNNDEWHFPLLAIRKTTIHLNDRICQFRLMKNQEPVEFHEVKKLNDNDRGGFGSTGVN